MLDYYNIRIRTIDAVIAKQAGQLLSIISPGPQIGGEIFQIIHLFKSFDAPFKPALLATAFDKFIETIINSGILLCSLIILISQQDKSLTINANDLFLPILFLSAFLLLLTITLYNHPTAILSKIINNIINNEKIHKIIPALKNSSDLTGHEEHPPINLILKSFSISVSNWIFLFSELYLLFVVANIPVSLSGYCLVFVATRVAFALPIPFGIGGLEASLYWAFDYLAYGDTAFIHFIAMVRARDIFILLIGMTCLSCAILKNADKATPRQH